MNTISSLLKFISYFEPLGSIKMFAGSTAPTKWLLCDGSAVSRTTYANLFAVIGTTYGSGDGSTTFNLPDFRGRTAIGAGTGTATDATAHSLGSVGGAETHTLSVNEMPSHNHDINTRYAATVGAYNPDMPWTKNDGTYSENNTAIKNTGGGQAHNNMQPYTAINYIIYAGV